MSYDALSTKIAQS